ncbi:unnamed protein product [Ixodes pacificus]
MLLVMIDAHSKWPEVLPTKSMTSVLHGCTSCFLVLDVRKPLYPIMGHNLRQQNLRATSRVQGHDTFACRRTILVAMVWLSASSNRSRLPYARPTRVRLMRRCRIFYSRIETPPTPPLESVRQFCYSSDDSLRDWTR